MRYRKLRRTVYLYSKCPTYSNKAHVCSYNGWKLWGNGESQLLKYTVYGCCFRRRKMCYRMEIDIINYLVNKTKTRKTIAKHAKFRKIFNSCENSSFLRYVRYKDECRVKFPCSLKWQARSVFVSSHGHDRRFPCTFAVSHGFLSDDSFGKSVSLLRQIVWKFLRKL